MNKRIAWLTGLLALVLLVPRLVESQQGFWVRQAGTQLYRTTTGASTSAITIRQDGLGIALALQGTGATIGNAGNTLGTLLKADALPTIASGFGTSPFIATGSTPLAGSVNVGTGGVATTGTINFNGTAFPSAAFCVTSTTAGNNFPSLAVPSTTQLILSSGTAWGQSTVVTWVCMSSK